MGAIYVDPEKNRAQINDEACVECGACFRGMSTEHLNPTMVKAVRKVAKFMHFRFELEPDVCPTGAFQEINELKMPRVIRQIFSESVVEHKYHRDQGAKHGGSEDQRCEFKS